MPPEGEAAVEFNLLVRKVGAQPTKRLGSQKSAAAPGVERACHLGV